MLAGKDSSAVCFSKLSIALVPHLMWRPCFRSRGTRPDLAAELRPTAVVIHRARAGPLRTRMKLPLVALNQIALRYVAHCERQCKQLPAAGMPAPIER